jgi:hypothetical protein
VWGGSRGIAGEPGRREPRGGPRRRDGGVLGGLFEHGGDLGHRDDIEVQGPAAGGVRRCWAVAFDQPEQPIHLTHSGPGQIVIEQAFGVDADVRAVAGRGGDQPVQIAHRVAGLVRRQIRRVGGPGPGGLTRMSLDELSAVVELGQLAVRTGRHRLPAQMMRNRVQRLGQLDVIVAGHLDLGVHRHRVPSRRGGQQRRGLPLGEHHRRLGARGAVDAQTGLLRAPPHSVVLGIGQIGEVLAGEEVVAHVLDHPLDAGFVLRVRDPGRVGTESAGLCVFQPADGEPRVH